MDLSYTVNDLTADLQHDQRRDTARNLDLPDGTGTQLSVNNIGSIE